MARYGKLLRASGWVLLLVLLGLWGGAVHVVAYAFESIDFAAIPGFSGTPPNLLVALDKEGKFMDVRVLSQPGKASSTNVYIDDVVKAIASVHILNQSWLAASRKVARATLG